MSDTRFRQYAIPGVVAWAGAAGLVLLLLRRSGGDVGVVGLFVSLGFLVLANAVAVIVGVTALFEPWTARRRIAMSAINLSCPLLILALYVSAHIFAEKEPHYSEEWCRAVIRHTAPLREEIEKYRRTHGRYPTDFEELGFRLDPQLPDDFSHVDSPLWHDWAPNPIELSYSHGAEEYQFEVRFSERNIWFHCALIYRSSLQYPQWLMDKYHGVRVDDWIVIVVGDDLPDLERDLR